jgi:phosphate transport system substrate-binding protein
MSETRLTAVSGNRPDIRDGLLFRIHGSNTIGAKLAPALVPHISEHWCRKGRYQDRKAEEVLVSGSFPGNSTPTEVEIQSYGSATAFNGLEKRACDIGAASPDNHG